MKTLTKKQRQEIYLKAAETIRREESGTVCVALKLLSGFVNDSGMLTETACKLFPEFASFKPKDSRYFWFNNYQERVKCLNECAEMCND